MKRAVWILVVALAGCDKDDWSQTVPDQCLRAELFKSCMASLPAGPQATKYNDWAEVVSECGSQSYYQSMRRSGAITKECRP